MLDPGLQRPPDNFTRDAIDRHQREIEAEVEHNRELHEARVARWKRSRLRAALHRAGRALRPHRHSG